MCSVYSQADECRVKQLLPDTAARETVVVMFWSLEAFE
jgi:uncharacterized protein YaiI (UPF0178 family)